MGVETSNQQQYGTDNALNELITLVPTMTKSQRNAWRMKGSDAILAEVARLRIVKATPVAIDPVAEEKAAEEAEEKPKSSRSKKSD